MINKIQSYYQRFRTPVLYSGGSIAKAISQLATGFIVGKLILPTELGVWNALSLATTYALFLQAGVTNGLNRELPYYLGKGEIDKATSLTSTAQLFAIVVSLAVLVVGFGSLLFIDLKNSLVVTGVIGVTIYTACSYFQGYLTSTFRSKSSFLLLAKIEFTQALLGLLTLLFIVFWGYYGMVLKTAFVGLVYVFMLYYFRPMRVATEWDMGAFFKLIKTGLPIFVLAYIVAIAATADRVVLLKMGGTASVGLYSFAMFAFTSFAIIPLSLANYIYPRMSYKFGQNEDKLYMWKYYKKVSSTVILMLLPLYAIIYFAIPLVINYFFPQYSLSIAPARILMLAAVFYGGVIGVNILWSMKAWKHMIIYQITLGLLLVTGPLLGASFFDNKLIGVAAGLCAAYTLNFISAYIISYSATHQAAKPGELISE